MRILYEPKGDGLGGVEEYVRNLKRYFESTEDILHADIVHANALGMQDRIDVFTLHGMYLSEDWGDTQDKANQIILDNLFRAKKVISVAKWYLPILQKIGIKDAIHIPNGIDPDRFHTGEFNYFLYLGSDNSLKNPNEVVKLAKKINYKFKVSAFRPYLPNVDFLGYPVNRDEVPDLIANCRALIMPYPREVCSTVTLEALASGKPILGAMGGSQSDLIIHKKTGYLYTDLEDMVNGAKWLLEHAEELEQNCLEESKNYTFEKLMPKIKEVYDSISELPVSVVILAYKNRNTLRRAIKSCGKGVEIIVVDASGDHRDLVPEDCIYVTTDNRSIGHNRNVGCSLATRPFTVFCDGDDYCLDGKTSLYRFFDSGVGMVVGNGWWGETTFMDFSRELHHLSLKGNNLITTEMLYAGNIIPSGAAMFRTELTKNIKFDETLKCGVEDYDFFLRVSEITKIKYIDRIVYYYTTGNPNSITRVANQNNRIEEIKLLLARAANRKGLDRIVHRELGEVFVSDYLSEKLDKFSIKI